MDYRTLESYLSILANTYVVKYIPPYHTNKLTELKKAKKLYFYDTGIRNVILSNFLPFTNRTDVGVLLENYVLNELTSMGYNPKHWRTTYKAEVDFVIETNGRHVPVEVKTKGKSKEGLASFIKKYEPKKP